MDFKKDNTCRLCGRLFCCIKCRKNHVLTEHSEEFLPDCPLCNNSDLVLRLATIAPYFAHIVQHHLPLACIKCNSIVESESDLRKLDHSCVLVKAKPSPDIVVTSSDKPLAKTPMFDLKSQMGAKTGSANLARSASLAYTSTTCSQVTTRLIRSTSTPTAQELTCVLKTTNHFLNGSVSHLSSICNQSSVLATTPGCTPPMAPKLDKFKLPLQHKVRSSYVQTPLRQVMSQNMKRVLLNHDPFSISVSHQINCPSPGSQPLDLRIIKDSPETIAADCEVVENIVNVEEAVVPDVLKTPMKEHLVTTLDSPDDCEFFTPHNVRYSRRRRSSIFVQVDEYDCEENSESDRHIELLSSATGSFEDNFPSDDIQEPKISLWNVLSSVFRFASNRIMPRADADGDNNGAPIVEEVDGPSNMSMKRRLTSPSQCQSPHSPRNPPKRIRGRPPIARMRQLKENN